MSSIKILFLVLFMFYSSSSNSQSLRIVSEKLPPLQYIEKDGSITGAMVDIVKLLLQKTHLETEIEILPWARSYQIALERKNTLIFSMLRGENRESEFIWLGKIFAIDSYLVALKGKQNFTVNSIEEAKKYSVGSIRQDLAESYLRKNGFVENKNLYLSADYQVLWHMLFRERTDLAFTNNILWRYEVADSNLDPSQIEIVYKIPDIASDLYIAASKGSDEKIIEQLKTALQEIKSNGQYQQILQKWQLAPI